LLETQIVTSVHIKMHISFTHISPLQDILPSGAKCTKRVPY